MKVNNQYITFNMLNAINCLDDVEDCNFVSDMDFAVVERLTSKEIKVATFEELGDERWDLETADITWPRENSPSKLTSKLNFLTF